MSWRCAISCVFLALGLSSGCAGPPRNSRLTAQDYAEISTEMACKLSQSRLLSERTANSEGIVVAVQKLENLSHDMIPVGAQWYMQSEVLNAIPLAEWSKQRNVSFVIPAERLREARQYGAVDEAFAAERRPTHVMTATIHSEAWASGKHRTDLYYCTYEITDLATSEIVWADKVEFKRLAEGIAWD